MGRRTALLFVVVLCVGLVPGVHATEPGFLPGAPGAGDPYFPLAGNGGYQVEHYALDLAYNPPTDRLSGTVTITAQATQDLSRFNLDFEGLTIESIAVNNQAARWSRNGGELVIRPRNGLRSGRPFVVVVRYNGVPESVDGAGFVHTGDGAMVAGQPRVAATWFPVNDHPIDKAAYTIALTVPRGLIAVSNGELVDTRSVGQWTTWSWNAKEPMAPYLVTAAIGEFDLRQYQDGAIKYWDAVDPDLYGVVAKPRTGTQFAISQVGEPAYKRLSRTISVPDGGAELRFWITRSTEPTWDFVFVEAHTVGQDDWTTLPDANGRTSQDTGAVCPYWLGLHPFLEHYQTPTDDEQCSPSGSSGEWWAASGSSSDWEQWSVDLAAWAGSEVEVSISYASDDAVQHTGVFIDDIVVSTGEGTTSFEADGDELDGWTVPGAPPESEPNPNDWIVGTEADTPPNAGQNIDASLARQPEIIAFLSALFGRYPFSASGAIVDDNDVLTFALETQTRPIYGKGFFSDPLDGDSVVVHELAHQWTGDSLALARWQHIWLNEGFATYAEWLWSENQELGTAQEIFDLLYELIPADDPFWSLQIGDPGPESLFDGAVYIRGAMTLHQLRLAVGEQDLGRILRRWNQIRAGQNVTTAQFIRLAEQVSGEELSELFDTWLFSTTKPVLDPAGQVPALERRKVPPVAKSLLEEATRSHRRR